MPRRTKKLCANPGCGRAVHGRYCEQHQAAAKQARQQRDEQRGTAASRGYGHKWRKAREGFLKAHPLCAHCEAQGRVTAATVVDHIDPHRGDMRKFWDAGNWQPLCKHHHDRKTAAGG